MKNEEKRVIVQYVRVVNKEEVKKVVTFDSPKDAQRWIADIQLIDNSVRDFCLVS
jgi:hypothetical protein